MHDLTDVTPLLVIMIINAMIMMTIAVPLWASSRWFAVARWMNLAGVTIMVVVILWFASPMIVLLILALFLCLIW